MNCIRCAAIFALILVLVSACSKAPFPTETINNNEPKEIVGKLIVTSANHAGQIIDSAQVYLDGQLIGLTPLTKEKAEPGIHALRIQKEGFEIYTEGIAIEAAKSVYIEALLKQLPVNKGQLLITVDQDSAITVVTDDRNEVIGLSYSREKTFVLDAGGYYLKTEKPGYRLVHLALEIRADSIVIENIRLEKLDNPRLPEIALAVPDSASLNAPVLISWESKDAETVDIDYIENPGLCGRREVIFQSPGMRYVRAIARNKFGATLVVDSVYIYENMVSPPTSPLLDFSASPGEVEFGDPITITWHSNGQHVIIDNGIGVRGPSGTEEKVFLTSGRKILTATAYGEFGLSISKKDTVIIKEPIKPLMPIIALAVVDSVQVGMPVTIAWHSQNANRVDVDYVSYPGLNGKAEVIFQTAGRRIITATAYNAAGQVSVAETLFVVSIPVLPQVAPILVDMMAKVCAIHPTGPQIIYNAGEMKIGREGYYRITATVWYDSGDSQKNESFFILIKDAAGNLHYPQDPNAGLYKVVPDDPGSAHVAFRDAGLFYLNQGDAVIQLHHYFTISQQFPQFIVNGPITGAESVEVISLKIEYDHP